jgi:hypothetical protein
LSNKICKKISLSKWVSTCYLKKNEQYGAISLKRTSYFYVPLGYIIPTENKTVFALTH